MVSVVYESLGGSTERYARAFASGCGLDAYPLGDRTLPPSSDIIFFGWRAGPMITGLKDAMGRYDVIAAVCVGLFTLGEKDERLMRKKNGIDTLFYLKGGMDRSALSPGQKVFLGIMNIVAVTCYRSEEDRVARRVLNRGGDLSSDDQLDAIIDWYGTIDKE